MPATSLAECLLRGGGSGESIRVPSLLSLPQVFSIFCRQGRGFRQIRRVTSAACADATRALCVRRQTADNATPIT